MTITASGKLIDSKYIEITVVTDGINNPGSLSPECRKYKFEWPWPGEELARVSLKRGRTNKYLTCSVVSKPMGEIIQFKIYAKNNMLFI